MAATHFPVFISIAARRGNVAYILSPTAPFSVNQTCFPKSTTCSFSEPNEALRSLSRNFNLSNQHVNHFRGQLSNYPPTTADDTRDLHHQHPSFKLKCTQVCGNNKLTSFTCLYLAKANIYNNRVFTKAHNWE